MVHLRRALLLFAIVLGLAAIAASVSRPRDEAGERATPEPGVPSVADSEEAPTVSPGTAATGEPLAEVTFGDAGGGRTRRVTPGQATTVVVEVDEPGQVEIPDLGLSATGDPLTPARFEIFPAQPGTLEVRFTSASGDESIPVGTLAVRAEPR
jgi:hypothetical protein